MLLAFSVLGSCCLNTQPPKAHDTCQEDPAHYVVHFEPVSGDCDVPGDQIGRVADVVKGSCSQLVTYDDDCDPVMHIECPDYTFIYVLEAAETGYAGIANYRRYNVCNSIYNVTLTLAQSH